MRGQVAVPSAPGPEPSTIGAALGLLGDTWTLLILQRAYLGIRRYGGWREALQISESVLADRLRTMTAAGLLETRPYRDEGRTRLEYRLTERALDLWPFFLTVWSWERAWVPRDPASGPLPDLLHDGCGRAVDIVLTCGGCGLPVGPRDTVTTRSTGVAVSRSLPSRLHPRRTRGTLPSDPLSAFPGTCEILGDRWGTAVLAAAMLGMRTFSDFRRELEVSPDVLSDRLRRFVAHGVLAPGYRLTDKGRATFPILACLLAWADRWMGADGHRPALTIVHRDCAAQLDPVLVCAGCGEPLGRRTVRFDVGEQRSAISAARE